MKKYLLAFISLIVFSSSFAQSTYLIKDKVSLEVIPFVKVKPNVGNPFLADIDGIISRTVLLISPFRIEKRTIQRTMMHLNMIHTVNSFLMPTGMN